MGKLTADLEEGFNSAGLAESQNEFIGMNVFQRLLCYVVRTARHIQPTLLLSLTVHI